MYRAPESAGGYKDAPYVAGPIWTGFYIGAHGGYAWGSADFPGTPAYNPADGNSGAPRPENSTAVLAVPRLATTSSLIASVIGTVADISFANLDKTVLDGNYLTETTKISQFGTLRAVAGYSFGRWLPYGTVGLAWADASYDMNCPPVAVALGGG